LPIMLNRLVAVRRETGGATVVATDISAFSHSITLLSVDNGILLVSDAPRDGFDSACTI
jgi:hypothetical protein